MATLARKDISDLLAGPGFAFVPGHELARLIASFGGLDDWSRLEASFDDLGLDTHMGDGGRYRRRRFGVFTVAKGGAIAREAHQPHYQGVEWNPLNGGIERWFEPMADDVADGASLRSILCFTEATFGALRPDVDRWHVEVHQFRIEARPGEAGKPTPEGMHRDEVDYVLVLLVRRTNIVSGETTIAGLDKQPLGSFTLTRPCDAALVDDRRVYHGVTPVAPVDPELPAHRDVLVVTFRAKG